MRHYEVQTTAIHYRVEVEQTLLTQEPAFIERNGEPLAVLLPIAAYEDRLDVLDQVWDQFGEVSCYIESVEPVTPRRARMPSVRIRK